MISFQVVIETPLSVSERVRRWQSEEGRIRGDGEAHNRRAGKIRKRYGRGRTGVLAGMRLRDGVSASLRGSECEVIGSW